MTLDRPVKIPEIPGKIIMEKEGNHYVRNCWR